MFADMLISITFVKRVGVIDDSPYYVFVALCIVVIVVSLIFKMAYRVRCAIANSKISRKHSIFSFEAAIFISDTTITTMQSATKTQ
jgi:hypothetical protein